MTTPRDRIVTLWRSIKRLTEAYDKAVAPYHDGALADPLAVRMIHKHGARRAAQVGALNYWIAQLTPPEAARMIGDSHHTKRGAYIQRYRRYGHLGAEAHAAPWENEE